MSATTTAELIGAGELSKNIIDSIPVDLLNQCAKVLSGYGFDLDEAKDGFEHEECKWFTKKTLPKKVENQLFFIINKIF
jgi:hypothetical protein